MAHPRWVALSGVVAVACSIPIITLLIIFAISLRHTISGVYIPAIVAAVITSLAMVCLTILTAQQFGMHWRCSYRLLLKATGGFCLVATLTTLATLIWLYLRFERLPNITIGSPTHNLIHATSVLCALNFCSACIFLLGMIKVLRQPRFHMKSSHTDDTQQNQSEMQERTPPTTPKSYPYESMNSPSPTAARNSFRASITQKIIRPISSKTHLITYKNSQQSPPRDSGTAEIELPVEDAFDSWDIDPESRQALAVSFPYAPPPPPPTSSSSISPHVANSGRFLETIPASPTGSRSPSPGFPLDLEPPSMVHGPRSQSPSNSICSVQRSRAASHSSMSNAESHIHPLFRTQSPDPFPNTTPNTVVTAAPGAGQLIADRQSIRRIRSGSLPTSPSPLNHSNSMVDIGTISRLSAADSDASDSASKNAQDLPEREMTPPIPDWILGAGSRTSMHGYWRRKVSPGTQGSLGSVDEVRESRKTKG